MAEILVGLVQLGFLGFAVAIMYLAFKLLQDLVGKDGSNLAALKLKIGAVIAFLGLSAGVLCLGIWFSFSDPNRSVSITLDLLPAKEKIYDQISLRRPDAPPKWKGQTKLSVKNDEVITVDMFDLMLTLDGLERRVAGLEAQQKKVLDSTLEAPAITGGGSDEQGI